MQVYRLNIWAYLHPDENSAHDNMFECDLCDLNVLISVYFLQVYCDVDCTDTTIAELIKEVTDSDDFMSSLAVEQGAVLISIFISVFTTSCIFKCESC